MHTKTSVMEDALTVAAIWQYVGAASLAMAIMAMCTVGYYQFRVWNLEMVIQQSRGTHGYGCGKDTERSDDGTKKGATDKQAESQFGETWTVLGMDGRDHARRVPQDEFPVQRETRAGVCPSPVFRTSGRAIS